MEFYLSEQQTLQLRKELQRINSKERQLTIRIAALTEEKRRTQGILREMSIEQQRLRKSLQTSEVAVNTLSNALNMALEQLDVVVGPSRQRRRKEGA